MKTFDVITDLVLINDFIVDNIPLQPDDNFQLKKTYIIYLGNDSFMEVTENDDYDSVTYNFSDLLEREDIEIIYDRYEMIIYDYLRRYESEIISNFSNKFKNPNYTETSQKIYYDTFVSGLTVVNNEFSKMIQSGKSLNFEQEELNDFQLITIKSVLCSNRNIISYITDKYSSSVFDFTNFSSVFGNNLNFIYKVYDGLLQNNFIDNSIQKADFVKILSNSYNGTKQIVFLCESGNEFHYFLKILIFKHKPNLVTDNLFYSAIAKRFKVISKKKSNGLKLDYDSLTKGISSVYSKCRERYPHPDSKIHAFESYLNN